MIRAVIFDVYGTLLLAPAGGVKPDPQADPLIRKVLLRHGHPISGSPSAALHRAVRRHHAASSADHPEVDLRLLWQEILGVPETTDLADLIIDIEETWHPAQAMPGAADALLHARTAGCLCGLLSNAQCNLPASLARALGPAAESFAEDLQVLSYRHGIAKPSAALFERMKRNLAARGIAPDETLSIGNDPAHDVVPAQAVGFRTALFRGHPDAWRPGECDPDFILRDWRELAALLPHTNPPPACAPTASCGER